LLQRYVDQRDEAAFTALVGRHGPLVLGVCRRLLWDDRDVEDAFQATFLVLARNAGQVRRPSSLAAWLYGVARRVALRARKVAAVRCSDAQASADLRSKEADPLARLSARELLDALDEELARLPEKYRLTLVLCTLDGLTVEQAAVRLGATPGVVRGRLQRGREQLRRALARRGLTLSAVLVGVGFSSIEACVTGRLLAAALRAAGYSGSPDQVPARVASLAEGVSGILVATKVTSAFALVLMLGLLTVGATLAYPERQTPPASTSAPPSSDATAPRLDRSGDPLPPGAIARLGTLRWRLAGSGLSSLAESPDGKTLAVATTGSGVSIIDMATGRLRRRVPEDESVRKACLDDFHGHTAISADGRTAVFSRDANVHVIDVATGRERRSWSADSARMIFRMALSADGRILATWSLDGSTHFWETETGKDLRGFPGPMHGTDFAGMHWFALSGDGKTVARVDFETGKVTSSGIFVGMLSGEDGLRRCEEKEGASRQIALSPDGRWLASVCDTGLAQLWDVNTGKVVQRWPGKGAESYPGMPVFSPDGRTLLIERPYDAIRLIDLASGKERCQIENSGLCSVPSAYAFTRDGQKLLGIRPGLGPGVYRYDTATGRRLLERGEDSGATVSAAFASGGQTIYTLGVDRQLRSWNVSTGEELRQTAIGTSDGYFSRDGRLLAASGKHVQLYDADSGKKLSRLGVTLSCELSAISADGKLAAVIGERSGKSKQKELVLYEIDKEKELHRFSAIGVWTRWMYFTAGNAEIFTFEVTPDNDRIGRVRVFDVDTGKERRGPKLPPCDQGAFAITPDGRTLVLEERERHGLDLYEASTGLKRLEIRPVNIWEPRYSFSPDYSFILVADSDGSVQIHDAITGTLLAKRSAHHAMVASFTWSADGQLMATAGGDSTALIWDARTFLPTRKPPTPPPPAELPALWDDLAGPDAAKAYQSIAKLALAPEWTIARVREKVRPVAEPASKPDRSRLGRLIGDLDNDAFEIREKAMQELAKYGEFAQPAYDAGLAGKPTEETRQRIDQLEAKYAPVNSPATRQALRALEVLEKIGSSEAQQVLKEFAKGAADARLTQDANQTLRRLVNRR
jgi:RNA polymerase sigma factor (sigma-70 family)